MTKPYIPDLLPLDNIDYNIFIKELSEANRAIARYDGLLGSIHNKSIFLSPFITQEAVLSSIIEGTQATFQEVLEFEADENKHKEKKDDIMEVRNYRKAMNHAVDGLKDLPLCLRLIKETHKILMDSVRGMNKDPGEFRRIQNWIGKPGSTIENASFVPPSPEKLPEYLSMLEKYMNEDEKDYIVQTAVIHAQFEILHPFLDGNGRIGRMLVPLFMYTKGIMTDPVFYISQYFEENRNEYYHHLNGITENGNWNGWIGFFIKAVLQQANSNSQKVKEMLELYSFFKSKLQELLKSARTIDVLDTLFAVPIFKASQFSQLTHIPPQTANYYIRILMENGILYTDDKNKQRTYFFKQLLDLLSY